MEVSLKKVPRGTHARKPDLESAERAIKEKEVPSHTRKLYREVFTGTSKAKAIKLFCFECQGFEKSEAVNCDNKTCPLWRHRPNIWK
jgi:hypothetical protein